MKKSFIRILGLCVFLSIFTSSRTNAGGYPADTSRKMLTGKKEDRTVVLKEANIIYPEIFAGNEEESLAYVEKFSNTRKEYLIRTYHRSKKIFPKVETILKKHDVPQEFKVLLALESGFNGNAVSRAGAVGYWQFMDAAAKEYGLKIPKKVKVESKLKSKKKSRTTHKKTTVKLVGVDDRKNFHKSTTAAARYLRDRSRNLDNDWLLIAASYNCGIGNVWAAMERSGKAAPTFWDIKKYLPAETRAYVMNFIAMNVIFHNYEAFSKNELYFRPVTCQEEVVVLDTTEDPDCISID